MALTLCHLICCSGNVGAEMLKPPLCHQMEKERQRGEANQTNKKKRARWSAVQDLLLAVS